MTILKKKDSVNKRNFKSQYDTEVRRNGGFNSPTEFGTVKLSIGNSNGTYWKRYIKHIRIVKGRVGE